MSSTLCHRIDDFIDGRLDAAERDAMQLHLATCEACQAALFEGAMLEAVASEAMETASPPAHVPTKVARVGGGGSHERDGRSLAGAGAKVLPFRRGRVLAIACAFVAVAAGVAAIVVPRSMPAPLAMSTASTRSLELRVSYDALDRYRPYEVQRGEGPSTAVPLDALAALEKKNDLQGLTAGWLAAGDAVRAGSFAEKRPSSPDADADLGAVALAQGKPSDALEALDSALAVAPSHPQALWNRALALRDLGFRLGAAAAFEKVAALGEAGWSEEARARASALRQQEDGRHGSWTKAADAGSALAVKLVLPPAEVVRAHPTYLRHFFYHALHGASTKEQLTSLAPLAETLDAVSGGHVLKDAIAWASARDFRVRKPLAETYEKLYTAPEGMPRAAVDAYLAQLRAAGEKDILLGALVLGDRVAELPKEARRLASERGDPWWTVRVERPLAFAEREAEDYAGAEERLRSALATCEAARLGYRCAVLEVDLAFLLARLYRTAEVRAVLATALPHVRSDAQDLEGNALDVLAENARLEGNFGQMRAGLEERVLASGDQCFARWEMELSLAFERNQLQDYEGARRALAALPPCGQPLTTLEADVRVTLDRLGISPLDGTGFRSQLAELRAREEKTKRPYVDIVEGRFLYAHGDPGAKAAVGRALEKGASTSPKLERYARLTLAMEAAKQGRPEEAMRELARIAGVDDAPSRCALGVAIDDERLLVVTRDAKGETNARLGPSAHVLDAVASARASEAIVGANELATLRTCDAVTVLASAPLHGLPRLLPPAMAWAYVSSAPNPDAAVRAVGAARRLVVADVEPPAFLKLPRLARWAMTDGADALRLEGPAATPERVLAELPDADEIELHTHGLVDLGVSDASFLALSPGDGGRFALTAGALRRTRLPRRPIVVLAACRATQAAPLYHEPWSMPMALVSAGARAVFGSPKPIPDSEAAAFFDAVLRRIHQGAAPAVALRDERAGWLEKRPDSWTADVLVFQ